LKHHAPSSSSARPVDALLAEYAAGSLPRALHALIGAHLDLNPQSERFVSDLEALGGAEIERQVPVASPSHGDMLAAILLQDNTSSAALDDIPPDRLLTPGLRHFIGLSSDAIPWRTVMPGVKEYAISDDHGTEAKLYWIKAGRTMPAHTHGGQEVTIVLAGGFTDATGHYSRGDVAMADEELDHKPVADSDADCICFAVTDAPLKLTGPVGKVIQSLFRN
jgi:putative transcriptional regulator